MTRRAVLGVVVLIGLVLGLGANAVLELGDDIDAADARADRFETRAALLEAQVRRLGGTPVPGAAGETGATGSTGSRGPAGRAPTAAEIAAAVAAYCAGDACLGADGRDGTNGRDGTDGEPGAAGPGPSDEQVAAAVADYCAAHNDCRGEKGDTGAAGPQGEPGEDGEDGQPPESFTFTFASTTWTCADPDKDGDYSCEPERGKK